MLHHLWGKARGHSDYVKAEWQELQARVDGLAVALRPFATEAGRLNLTSPTIQSSFRLVHDVQAAITVGDVRLAADALARLRAPDTPPPRSADQVGRSRWTELRGLRAAAVRDLLAVRRRIRRLDREVGPVRAAVPLRKLDVERLQVELRLARIELEQAELLCRPGDLE